MSGWFTKANNESPSLPPVSSADTSFSGKIGALFSKGGPSPAEQHKEETQSLRTGDGLKSAVTNWFGGGKGSPEVSDVEAGNSKLLKGGSSKNDARKDMKGVDRLRTMVGMEVKEQTALDKVEDACNSCGLTYKQRIFCFAGSFGVGVMFFALAAYSIPFIALLWYKFAIFFGMGNVFIFISASFLVGPVRQVKTMCHPSRAVAACIVVLCLGLTLWTAIKAKMLASLFFMTCQILAYLWYALSYIPFARKFIISTVKSVLNK